MKASPAPPPLTIQPRKLVGLYTRGTLVSDDVIGAAQDQPGWWPRGGPGLRPLLPSPVLCVLLSRSTGPVHHVCVGTRNDGEMGTPRETQGWPAPERRLRPLRPGCDNGVRLQHVHAGVRCVQGQRTSQWYACTAAACVSRPPRLPHSLAPVAGIESRLRHMCPVELVLPESALSQETETLLREWIEIDGACCRVRARPTATYASARTLPQAQLLLPAGAAKRRVVIQVAVRHVTMAVARPLRQRQRSKWPASGSSVCRITGSSLRWQRG